ncbi:TetR/AcrR family transcriptional regulator [Nocardia sp. SYP-A9097]|uniref:TetR/AcrR family transcriptional regulator n=1 Tax=Nocardia sp. SYP-A9097 TaxID=2663237 RepID=UPI001E4A8257|nr:TetR family transcriptional regulator [Nocardia sp. SYP-A9097]
MIERPEKLLDGGLRSEDVIHLAGSSHATFYRKFASKSRYLDEVLRELVDTVALLPADIRPQVRAELDTVGGDCRRAVRAMVRAHFDRIFNAQTGTRRLLATALGPTNSQALRVLRAGYSHTDALILQLFEVLFAHTGATFRKPLNSKSFSVVLTAMLDGFIIRHRAEPQVVTADLVADSILAVLNVAVDNTQRHGHIDDALTAIGGRPGRSEQLPPEPRVALIAAGRSEFTKRGYFMASIDTIAAEARVPPDAALRIFPTKVHLIVGGLKSGYEALRQGVADDLSLDQDVASVVRNHFLRVARLVVAERAFMDALIAAVAHDTYAEPDSLISIKRELNFPGLLAPVIERGQRNGAFSDGEPAAELAALLTDTLLLRCFTRRGNSPEQNADFVFALVLNGLRAAKRSASD